MGAGGGGGGGAGAMVNFELGCDASLTVETKTVENEI